MMLKNISTSVLINSPPNPPLPRPAQGPQHYLLAGQASGHLGTTHLHLISSLTHLP